MGKSMSSLGLFKGHFAMHWGGRSHNEELGDDAVLDHIILDLTGDSVPLNHIADPSVQRDFKKKKRLLKRSNTVLISRVAIMALVATMLVLTTVLTWYYTSTYSARSVKSVAFVLRKQILRTSVQTMASVLGEVYNATLVVSSLHQQVYFGTSNKSWESLEPQLREVNRGVFRAQTQHSSVAFVSNNGLVTDYSRGSGRDYYFFINRTYGSEQIWYYQNITGFVNDSQAPPAQRRPPPYPLSAENVLHKRPQEVYWTVAPNLLGIPVVSPAIPTKDALTDAFLGLSTVTSTFSYLNRYLSTVDLLGGYLYFAWKNGTESSAIVAFSYNDTNDILVNPQNASNPVVRSAAKFLASRYGYETSLNETHNDDVELAGQKYYIDTMAVTQTPFDALNLVAIMIVPRKSIMGGIDHRNRTVIGVTIGTSLGVLVLGCCFICFLTNKMSTEMRLRKELIRLLVGKHRAEQSSNYKTQFLANMGHELRTPMAGIIGLLDLLSCDVLSSEQKISVSQIRNCATGLLALVNNVLDISKVEAGRMELQAMPFHVSDELELVVDMFAAQPTDSNVDVVLDLSDSIPLLIGDVTRIRQIFSNLISNSLKFTTNGYVLIRGWVDQSIIKSDGRQPSQFVKLTSQKGKFSDSMFSESEDKVALVFEVEDSGCGIPIEMQETIFNSFVQGDSSMTRVYGGSGLGLYIVRSLVELMGGEVRVVPKDSGTLMRLHIVLEKASDSVVHQGNLPMAPSYISQASERDGLNSWLGSPSSPLSSPLDGLKMPSREVLEKTQVVLAMREGVTRKVVSQWLERSGVMKIIHVSVWEEIVSILENVCADASVKLETDRDVQEALDRNWPLNPSPSPEDSTAEVSEKRLESVNFPSVLALVDMHLGLKDGFKSKSIEPAILGPDGNVLCKADPVQLPSHIQDMMNCMLRIRERYSVGVGWVVTRDCGARWNHALQADGCFTTVNKPLHSSRMKRLLAFMFRKEGLKQRRWEVHRHESDAPANPSVGATGTPSEGEHLISTVAKCRDPTGHDSRAPSVNSLSHTAPHGSAEEVTSDNVAATTTMKGSSADAGHHSRNVSSGTETVGLPEQRAQNFALVDDDEVNISAPPVDLLDESMKVGPDVTERKNLRGPPFTSTSSDRASELQRELKVDDLHPTGEEHRQPSNTKTFDSPNTRLSTSRKWDSNVDRVQGAEARADEVEAKVTGRVAGGPDRDFGLSKQVQQMRNAEPSGPAAAAEDGKPASQPSSIMERREIGESSQNNAYLSQAGTSAPAKNSASLLGSEALSSMHILLVEDTPVLQRLANMMLRKMGADVTVVGDGLQAVTAVSEAVEAAQGVFATRLNQRHNFDLILMDCAMPVMDGYSATKAIRAAEKNTSRHIPIVALTAHALASDEERCLSVGMDAYLTKPINLKLLVTTIQDLVLQGRR